MLQNKRQMYLNFVSGNLHWKASNKNVTFKFSNKTTIKFQYQTLDGSGRITSDAHQLKAGEQTDDINADSEALFLITTAQTGSYVAIVKPTSGSSTLDIDVYDLLNPGDIGSPPAPTEDVIIPSTPIPALVGISPRLGDKEYIIIREQSWTLDNQSSYSLSPGEKKQISYSITEGIDDDSSQTKAISNTSGVSVSAGSSFSMLSGSVSTSLSSSSQSSHSVSFSQQSTKTYLQMLENKSKDNSMVVSFWKFLDLITWMDGKAKTDPLPVVSVPANSGPAIPVTLIIPHVTSEPITAKPKAAQKKAARKTPRS
jgi:hypothetical protein